jgi:nucleotide-binding universal stress UspA family protein
MTIHRILCPVDFSECSRHAAAYAVMIARRWGASVTAVNVLPPVASFIPPSGEGLYPPFVFTPGDLQQFRAEVDAFVRGTGVDIPLDAVVVEGSVVAEITRLAEEVRADLVVMGTHGRSGFDRLVLGSVAEKMLRKAPCPVLTVPPRVPEASPTAVLRRVLCAVDFSPSSIKALEIAEALAAKVGARLTVLHVLEPASVLAPVPMGGAGSPPAEEDTSEQMQRRLERVISKDASLAGHVSTVVVPGKPHREILRLAGEQHGDLIVVGAHGGRVGVLAFGSVTNHVVREAACPVLTVRA